MRFKTNSAGMAQADGKTFVIQTVLNISFLKLRFPSHSKKLSIQKRRDIIATATWYTFLDPDGIYISVDIVNKYSFRQIIVSFTFPSYYTKLNLGVKTAAQNRRVGSQFSCSDCD